MPGIRILVKIPWLGKSQALGGTYYYCFAEYAYGYVVHTHKTPF